MKNKYVRLKYVTITTVAILALLLFIGISLFTSTKQNAELSNISQSQTLRSTYDDPIETPILKQDNAKITYSISYQENPNLEYLNINKDYMGWISISGTRIDYPIVRGQDNLYYLDHDFYQENNKYGAIFMDYRNIGNFLDEHTIIYGHTLKDDQMFADLKKYLDEDFLRKNPYIVIEGLYETKEYEIISVYEEKASDIEINLHKVDDSYIESLMNLSLFETQVIPRNGKLLTLATCTYSIDDGRLIVHAIER